MKTKTLLIAAAALAAGVMSSQAQVYSQNIVGYVNIPHVAGTFYLEAPTLDLDGTGTNNTVSTVYANPALQDNVFVYNPSLGSYDTLTFQSKNIGSRATPLFVTNWFDANGNEASNYPINPGQGVFFEPAINETNTQVGVVLQGSLTNPNVPAAGGFNILGSQVPIAGGLTSVLNYQPNLSDNAYIYTNGSYDTYTYQIKNIGSRATPIYITNWIDANSIVGEPNISVGQGFWLNPAVNNAWVETFTNQ